MVSVSDDGGSTWGDPAPIHQDKWAVDQCPHSGPALGFDSSGGLHAAWYTGKKGSSGIYYSRSDDGA